MKVVVTGGAGFIGSALSRLLVERGHDVDIVDKLTYAGDFQNVEDLVRERGVGFVKADVCDKDAMNEAVQGAHAVVHLAAETHVDRSILDASSFVRTEVEGTRVVLDMALRYRVQRIIVVSTDEVYGDTDGMPPAKEGDAMRPASPYAAAKAGADLLALAYAKTYGAPVVVTRSVNNYGPRQHPEKFIPRMAAMALDGKNLPLYGDGMQRRSWIHVNDHCEAILALIAAPARAVVGQAFNVAGPDAPVFNAYIAGMVLMWAGGNLVEFVPDRPGHVRCHEVDASLIGQVTDWKPTRSLATHLDRTLDWYRKNLDWLKRKMGEPDFVRHVASTKFEYARRAGRAERAASHG